jgi:type II secretory pathway pseudopilin PulG
MKNNNGVTLIEIIIAMTIMIIASLGFLVWETNMFRNNAGIERNNTAYAIAMDVAERLQRISDNSLIMHNTARKCVGHDSAGNLRECLSSGTMSCSSGSPTGILSVGITDTVKYANPWNGTLLYLYDNNNCQDKSWTDTGCGDSALINAAANANIDHPNALGTAYNAISPIRSYRGVTYYAVWSVAYMPCNAGTETSKRKIFVTVYWMVPEPRETTGAAVEAKIAAGAYSLKNVSIVVDKVIGTES